MPPHQTSPAGYKMRRMEEHEKPILLRFGVFEADLVRRELRKRGRVIDLQRQPFDVLVILLEHPDIELTHEQFREAMWDKRTVADIEKAVRTAVSKVREVLGDSTAGPRFIETIPGKGYRFIAPVTREYRPPANTKGDSGPHVAAVPPPAIPQAPYLPVPDTTRPHTSWRPYLLIGGAALISLASIAYFLLRPRTVFTLRRDQVVLLSDFEDSDHDARLDAALRTALNVALEQGPPIEVYPRVRLEAALQRMQKPRDTELTAGLAREVCIRDGVPVLVASKVAHLGNKFALQASIIEPQENRLLRTYTITAPPETLLNAVDTLAQNLRKGLTASDLIASGERRPLPDVTTSSLAALEQYADGQKLWHNGQYVDAVARFNSAVALDPGFAMAHAALGNANMSYILHDKELGRKEYEAALQNAARLTDRERMAVHLEYVDSLNYADQAEIEFPAYLHLYPADYAMRFRYAQHLRTHGQTARAIEELRELARQAPDDATTYVELATAYSTQGDHQAALDAYEKAFHLNPRLNRFEINRQYGFTLVALGRTPRAYQTFTDQLQAPDTRESGLRSLGILNYMRGDLKQAHANFGQAVLIDDANKWWLSSARTHLWLAYIAERENDSLAVKRESEAALQHFDQLGKNVVLGAWVGSFMARTGYKARAKQILVTITPLVDRANKQEVGYHDLLRGEIAFRDGDYGRARDLLLLAREELEPSASQDFALATLAEVYQRTGHRADAIGCYEQFVGQGNKLVYWEPLPQWLDAHDRLAELYAQVGQPVKAQSILARSVGFRQIVAQ